MAVVHALMLGHIIEELITLIVVLNPIDAIPIFLTATARLDERDRQRTVFIAVFVAILVLMLFLWFGNTYWKRCTSAFRHSRLPALRCCFYLQHK